MTAVHIADVLPGILPRLWRFALRLSGDTHDAEDLLQRACLRALERADQLQPDTTPLSWMFSILHSTWINEVRARSVRGRTSIAWDDAFLETVTDPFAPTPESSLMHRQIIATVERLPEMQRVVMLLVSVEGLSYAEVALILDVPIGTVMSRLSRARLAVGAMLTKRGALDSARSGRDSFEGGNAGRSHGGQSEAAQGANNNFTDRRSAKRERTR